MQRKNKNPAKDILHIYIMMISTPITRNIGTEIKLLIFVLNSMISLFLVLISRAPHENGNNKSGKNIVRLFWI